MKRGTGRGLLWRRWTHLLLGGALLMPYVLLCGVALQTAGLRGGPPPFGSLGWAFAAYALALPLVALTALVFPLVRSLETTAAEALCGLPPGLLAPGPARSSQTRRRSAAWFTLHTGLGALVSGSSLAVPPLALALLAVPFVPALRETAVMGPYTVLLQPTPALSPVYGLAMLVLLAAAAHGAGALLARCAPVLLGPTTADRLAAAEERAVRLAARNRVARELHDSIGHALSAVALQAGAARLVMDTDPEFVREALTAIEETTQDAVAELDSVLGTLREEDTPHPHAQAAPARPQSPDGLRSDLQRLLHRTRAAGLHVDCDRALIASPALDALPPDVAHTTYRIVQEGLGNALHHAPAHSLRMHLTVTEQELTITMENPLPGPGNAGPAPRGGGRGLRGIAERATLLGGTAAARPEGGVWQLAARLPLRTEGGR